MIQVHPSRDIVSDRFPVASFVVRAPPDRVFEVACATDPALFSPQQRHRRTPANFYTSRAEGLLRAPAGQATWLVPPAQLRRFAGASRLYFAVGHYGSPRGEDPQFTLAVDNPREVPFIRLAPDFTGRTLDRGRFGGAPSPDARYGRSGAHALSWGADLAAPPAAAARYGDASHDYDDGFDPSLWRQAPGPSRALDLPPPPEPPGFEDAVDAGQAGGGVRWPEPAPAPVPMADAPAPATYGRRAPLAEPAGLEHAPVRIGGAPQRRAAVEPPGIEHAPTRRLGGDGAVAAAPTPTPPVAGVPLTIPEKLRVVQVVSRRRTGTSGNAAYAFVEATDGLAWGILGFRQRTGALGAALSRCRQRDPGRFAEVFGPAAEELLAVTNGATPDACLALVGGQPLTSPAWVARFQRAAEVEAFVYAQNQAAVEALVDPVLPGGGPLTDRVLALLVAIAAFEGVDAARAARAAAAGGDAAAVVERLAARGAGTPLGAVLADLRGTPDLYDTVYEAG